MNEWMDGWRVCVGVYVGVYVCVCVCVCVGAGGNRFDAHWKRLKEMLCYYYYYFFLYYYFILFEATFRIRAEWMETRDQPLDQ